MSGEKGVFVGITVGDTRKYILDFLEKAVDEDFSINDAECYFGIIACACLFESVLEEHSSFWLGVQQSTKEGIDSRIMQKMRKDVSKSTGLDAWKAWMKVLFDIDICSILGEKWKSLVYLFRLRNQLAHGRTTKFPHYYRETGEFIGMSFEGSVYKESIEFLIEKGVVSVDEGVVPGTKTFINKKVVKFFKEEVESSILLLSGCSGLSGLADGVSSKVDLKPNRSSSSFRDHDLVEKCSE